MVIQSSDPYIQKPVVFIMVLLFVSATYGLQLPSSLKTRSEKGLNMERLTDRLGVPNSLITPLDFVDFRALVRHLIDVAPHAGLVKVGSKAVKAFGEVAIADLLREFGLLCMWDEKPHDIPSQMADAAAEIVERAHPRILTMHASSGSDGIRAVVDAVGSDVLVAAVTVLTSLSDAECRKIYGRPVNEVVPDLALLAADSGARAVVCSPQELRFLATAERSFPQIGGLYRIVPGIRSPDSPPDDQQRKATPFEAARDGADALVVGRLISGAENPEVVAQAVVLEYQRGLEARMK